MEHKYRLSICMMVRDEEKNLGRCLESLKTIIEKKFAELIIVDTGSVDGTMDIAREYTDRVYQHPWNNDFSDMRNITIGYAKGEWVFIVDADEQLENPEEVIRLFESNETEKYNTISVRLKNVWIGNKMADNYVINQQPRIFRNDVDFCYKGAVHNQPVCKGPTLASTISFMHYGYIGDDRDLVEKKFKRTSTILKDELKKNPKNLYYQFQLAVSYYNIDNARGLTEMRKAHNLFSKLPKERKKSYAYLHGIYARFAFGNKEYQEVIDICREGIMLCPQYIDLYFLMGNCYMDRDITEAERYLKKYLKLHREYNNLVISRSAAFSIYHMDPASYAAAHYNLSKIYFMQNQLDKAVYHIKQVREKAMDDPKQKSTLLVGIALKAKDCRLLREYYESIKDDNKLSEDFIVNLENAKKGFDEELTVDVEETFAEGEDRYNLLNRIRTTGGKERDVLVRKMLDKADFNSLPPFYGEVFRYIVHDVRLFTHALMGVKSSRIRAIIIHLLREYDDMHGQLTEYLNNVKIRFNDFNANRVFAAVAGCVLINAAEKARAKSQTPGEEYQNLFLEYIEKGINYLTSLYQGEKFRLVYRMMESEEEQFIVLMHLAADGINRGNTRRGIEYFREGIQLYPYMTTLTEKYREELGLIKD